ncbi:MAG: hypothetical protein AB7S81_00180 [Bdellovibrionales bacterium]
MAQGLKTLSPDDAWRAFVVCEAGKEIGQWLEGRGRLHHPIARLTLAELTIMADNAISRFIVLASERAARHDPQDDTLIRFLYGDCLVPCVDANPEASSSIKPSRKKAKTDGSSARCRASKAGATSSKNQEGL